MQPVECVRGDYGSLVIMILSNKLENVSSILGVWGGGVVFGRRVFCFIFDISSLSAVKHDEKMHIQNRPLRWSAHAADPSGLPPSSV